jgi:transcriptional regulator with XRE-family HTH domain
MTRTRTPPPEASAPGLGHDQQPRYGRGTGVPHPVDVHVGTRVWQSRRLRGVTQQDLAERLGLTFQQVQKYETGANRISASKLAVIADILDLPVAFFFGDMVPASGTIGAGDQQYRDLLRLTETMDLIHNYDAINAPDVQKSFLALVQAAAAAVPAVARDERPPPGLRPRLKRSRNPKT